MPDFKKILAKYDALKDEQKNDDAAAALVNSKEDPHFAMFRAIGNMQGLRMCKYCNKKVSLMSKCKNRPSEYHVDFID